MKENMPPGAVVLEDVKTSTKHNKQQHMENSMKGRGYEVSDKDLEQGYTNTGEQMGDKEYHISIGVPRLIY